MAKYWRFFQTFVGTTWQSQSAYRVATILWIINGSIIPLLLMSIWLTIQNANELPMNNSQIITYYLLTIVVIRLTQSWEATRLSDKIHNGTFAAFLLRPFPYWLSGFSIDNGLRAIRLVTLTPFILIFLYLFNHLLELNLTFPSALLFILASGIGYLLNFVMQNIVGLFSFWLQHASGAIHMHDVISWLFNGSLIPAPLMPPVILGIALYTPFWYVIGFPISILMDSITVTQMITGFCISLLWLVGLIILWQWVYGKGIKNFTAVGM